LLPLANALRPPCIITPAQKATWQAVTQPALGAGQHLHIALGETDLFFQFTVQRLFRCLARHHAALRELPGIPVADPPAPEYTTFSADQNNADVQPKALLINNACHL